MKQRCTTYNSSSPQKNVQDLLNGDLPSLNRLKKCPGARSLFNAGPETASEMKQREAKKSLLQLQRKRLKTILRSVPTLAKLNAYQQAEIIDALRPVEFEKGTYVIKQGEKGDEFFIIVEGTVSITVWFCCSRLSGL